MRGGGGVDMTDKYERTVLKPASRMIVQLILSRVKGLPEREQKKRVKKFYDVLSKIINTSTEKALKRLKQK